MPATVNASPNPVHVASGGTGTTTLYWNGAEQGSCRLYRAAGATETLIAPLPDPGAPGEVTGSVKVTG